MLASAWEVNGFPYRNRPYLEQTFSIERRSFECTGSDLADAGRSPAQDCFAGEKREREPDQNESDEMSARKWLVIKENAKKERTNRRKILEEADRDEAEVSGAVPEPEERNGGGQSRADEAKRTRTARAAEQQRAPA